MHKYFNIIDGVAVYKACPVLLSKYPLFKSIEKLLESTMIDDTLYVYLDIRLNEFQLKMYDNNIAIIFDDVKTTIHDLFMPIKVTFIIYNSDPEYCEIFVDKIKLIIKMQ